MSAEGAREICGLYASRSGHVTQPHRLPEAIVKKFDGALDHRRLRRPTLGCSRLIEDFVQQRFQRHAPHVVAITMGAHETASDARGPTVNVVDDVGVLP
jgi:hypothetical protein